MNPRLQSAGIAGILAGVALVGEFIFFMISGYNPQSFSDPAAALAFLRDSGAYIRVAVLFGAAGVALRTIFVAGLAASLQSRTPTRAAATLYFGILGGVGHGLVALSFYIGIPMLIALAARDPAAAANAWGAFTTITSGFEGFGNFLLGLTLLAAGWAIVSHKALPVGAGWVGLLAGSATVVRVFATGTPLAVLALAVFFPSLILAGVFNVWAGIALWRSGTSEHRRRRSSAGTGGNSFHQDKHMKLENLRFSSFLSKSSLT